ncbi:unnamed protein product [Peronospora belbahrii]|uniref:WD repeat-containing protein 75 second beta-propeller domain-containing protein n=1 Tax=Peronospora belbahrii TaxID=622444 RepID=A0ABN8CRN3_9STRA|nr:unnamed protein product [Peronospora belbahrii]
MTMVQESIYNQEQVLELLTPPLTVTSSSSSTNHVGLYAATLLYSADGRYVFQRQAHVVRVLHAPSGRLLHECTRSTSTSTVCAFALHPHNALQLLAAYQDGYILLWDFMEQKSLVEIDTKTQILWMASSLTSPSQLLLIVSTNTSEKKNSWCLVEFSLKKKTRGRTLFESSSFFQAAALQSYLQPQNDGNKGIPISGDYLVIAAGQKIITGWLHDQHDAKDSSNRVFIQQKFHHVRNVTCIAIHPIQREFSIGDQVGQIFRYNPYQSTGRDSTVSTAMMHWHSHAVHCMQYSNDGQFLLSGGEECVLVTWQLETGRRSYLPRLSAPVEVIALRKDGGVFVVGLADNVLFQYNPVTREQEWEARGLARGGRSAADSLPTRQLVVDPVSKALVMNGSSGAGVLQFYEPFTDRVLQTLLLSERNQVTRTDDEVLPTLLASHTCFSSCGGALVTLHAPTTMKECNEQSLRFWTRHVDGSFFVNTAVDAPHDRARVTSVVFSPTVDSDCVVTADDEGDFKVWQKSVAETGGASWHCQSVVRFRDEPITAVGFARDGSLLAVAYGNKLTIWDVTTRSLRRVLPSADGQKINQIVFPGINSPFVVVVTASQVQVWSLLSLSLWWRYTVPMNAVVAEEALHERFLIWMSVEEGPTNKTLVLVFDPQTPVPSCVRVVNFGSKVWSAGFHPGTEDIILVDNKTGVWRLDGPNARSLDARRRKQAHVAAVASRMASKNGEREAKALSTIYNAANGGCVSQKINQSKITAQNSTTGNGSASSSLFDAPAHVLPSMTALYRSFMDTMLPKSHQVIASSKTSKDAIDEATSSQTKKNKRRKKQLQQQQPVVDFSANENSEQRKRMKLQVEKDLANPELQQQTYSKLLETFRNSKARRRKVVRTRLVKETKLRRGVCHVLSQEITSP